MKISYNWLKDFIDINVSAEKLAEDLSLFGHEVESIEEKDGDFVLDFEITPNRGDCLSMYGIAREIAALYGIEIKYPISDIPKETELDKKININIEEDTICPRYSAVVVENVLVSESPKWLKDKLTVLGIKPINNIVDITNFIMLELGQPMHSFDYDKIIDSKFNIRLAKDNETVTTLDGKIRELNNESIIIEDNDKIFDLAGIMGGQNSEVDDTTHTIVLEAAIFNSVLIRKTSKTLSLQTDASYRYERGVDVGGTILALQKAMSLILEMCPNAKFGKIIDINNVKKFENKISIKLDKINNLIGSHFKDSEAKELLNKLNIKLDNNIAIVPSYRIHDVTLWQDIAEELARIYGYNKLGVTEVDEKSAIENPEFNTKEYIKDILVENGFSEVYSYSFSDKRVLTSLGFDLTKLRKVINGLTPETEYLRPSLLPSILTAIQKNPWAPDVKIFEIGKVFMEEKEKWQLGIGICAKKDNELQNILSTLDIKAEIVKIDQKLLDMLKIRRPVLCAILDLKDIKIEDKKYDEDMKDIKYNPVSEFPPTIRDLAFVLDNSIKSDKIIDEIKNIDKNILFVELFDEFTSPKLGENKKSLAFHIWLQSMKAPVLEEDANSIVNKIIDMIQTKFKGILRG